MTDVLVIGGCVDACESHPLASVERIHIASSGEITVTTDASLHIARRSAAVGRTDSIVVVGGCSSPQMQESSVEIRNTNDGCWSPSPIELLERRSCAAYCNVGSDRVLIVGGFDREPLRSVELLTATEAIRLTEIPFALKNATALADSETSALIIGGWDGHRSLRTIYRYNIDTNGSMELIALLPYEIEAHAAVRRGALIYIIGGYNSVRVVDSIIVYNIENGECRVLDGVRLAVACENLVAHVIGDRYLLVAGGWNGYESMDAIDLFEFVSMPPYLVHRTHAQLAARRNRPCSIVL